MYTNNDFDICLVQGDDFNIVYQFTDTQGKILDNTTIANVYMTCEKLNYQATLGWDSVYKGFSLSVPATTTTNFLQGIFSYDITVYFTNTLIQTEIYEAKIQVLLKKNRVVIASG